MYQKQWYDSVIEACALDVVSSNHKALFHTVEHLYSRHPWGKYKCPDYRDVLISKVNLYCKVQFGSFISVLNTGVSLFQG